MFDKHCWPVPPKPKVLLLSNLDHVYDRLKLCLAKKNPLPREGTSSLFCNGGANVLIWGLKFEF